ncbi:MAG: magnesium transporter, partial [Lactococcus sp.]|nr:magnesium transporter [Lactococcus sp.]
MTDNSPDPQNVFLALQELLEDNDIQAFREGFLNHHIYDQSQFYLDFTETERLELYSILSPQELSEIFENLDFDSVDIKPYLKEISPEYLSAMFDEMSTDNAADILTNLTKRERRSIFTLMAPENVSE